MRAAVRPTRRVLPLVPRQAALVLERLRADGAAEAPLGGMDKHAVLSVEGAVRESFLKQLDLHIQKKSFQMNISTMDENSS